MQACTEARSAFTLDVVWGWGRNTDDYLAGPIFEEEANLGCDRLASMGYFCAAVGNFQDAEIRYRGKNEDHKLVRPLVFLSLSLSLSHALFLSFSPSLTHTYTHTHSHLDTYSYTYITCIHTQCCGVCERAEHSYPLTYTHAHTTYISQVRSATVKHLLQIETAGRKAEKTERMGDAERMGGLAPATFSADARLAVFGTLKSPELLTDSRKLLNRLMTTAMLSSQYMTTQRGEMSRDILLSGMGWHRVVDSNIKGPTHRDYLVLVQFKGKSQDTGDKVNHYLGSHKKVLK
jgi:hypothetical protein